MKKQVRAPGRSLACSCSNEQIRAIRGKCKGLAVTIIEIREFGNGWKFFEAPSVAPVFFDQEQAIDYPALPCVGLLAQSRI
jgi:hypothetical protein